MTTATSTIVEELGTGTVEALPLPVDEATLCSVITDIFTDWWEHIHFGVLVQGAAWEIAAPNAPVRISSRDGYVTVDFGRWHFHLCIGEHRASGPELADIRRCHRAEMYRGLRDGRPASWGIRLFNGRRSADDRASPPPVVDRHPADPRQPRLGPPGRLGHPSCQVPGP